MGNENHSTTCRNKSLHDFKKFNDFTWCKHRGGFVEHHNFCVTQQHLHDFNALLNTYRQVFNDCIGVEIKVVFFGNFAHHSARFINVEFPERSSWLYTEHHVFGNSEYGNEHEVLVDHADSCSNGISWRRKHQRGSINNDFTLVGFIHAIQHAHQRGFACAVFTDE